MDESLDSEAEARARPKSRAACRQRPARGLASSNKRRRRPKKVAAGGPSCRCSAR